MAKDTQKALDKWGLFGSYEYVSEPYVPLYTKFPKEPRFKGKQMLSGGYKSRKTGTMDGYFSKKLELLQIIPEKAAKKKEPGHGSIPFRFFIAQQPEGSGNYYGTIGGKIEYFSPSVKPTAPKIRGLKNFTIKPGKKGTGYGYPHVGIGHNSKDPPYFSPPLDHTIKMDKKETSSLKPSSADKPIKKFVWEPFAPFSLPQKPTKIEKPEKRGEKWHLSGKPKAKSGLQNEYFSKVTYVSEPYKPTFIKKKEHYIPFRFSTAQNKTLPIVSIINSNVSFKVNQRNYKDFI